MRATSALALALLGLAGTISAALAAQDRLCRESSAISEAAQAGQYSENWLLERMFAWCKPGDLVYLKVQQAPFLCDFGKQILQEGNGTVVCVMASPPPDEPSPEEP